MANWFYYDSNANKLGPINNAQLKILAANGTIRPDTIVEMEDGKSGRAGKIKGLTFPPIAPAATTPEPEMPLPVPPQRQENILSKVYANAKIAASVAAKQIAIKKLQMATLPAAYQKLGSAAYAQQVGKQQFSEIYQEIDVIKARITARLNAEAKPGESIAEKSARIMANAKNKVAHEKDVMGLNKKFAELGKRVFEDNFAENSPAFVAETDNVRKVQSELDKLQQECNALNAQGHAGFRKKLVAAAAVIAVLAAGYFVWGFWSNSPEKRIAKVMEQQNERDGERRQEEVNQHKKRMEEERQRTEMEKQKQKELDEKREQERQLAEVRKEAEQAARATERKQRELEAQRLSEAEKIAKEQKLTEERAKRTDRDKQAQEDRKKYAETLFSTVSLDPKSAYFFSNSAKKRNLNLEIRGTHSDEFAKASRDKDWLKIISLIEGREYTEYPDVNSIESAFRKLGRLNLQMLLKGNIAGLKTQYDDYSRQDAVFTLAFYSFDSVCRYYRFTKERSGMLEGDRYYHGDQYGIAEVERMDWNVHPDGIGYYRKWTPVEGQRFFIIGNSRNVGNKCEEWGNRLGKEFRTMQESVKLGDITHELAAEKMQNFYEKLLAEATEWCKNQ